MASFNVLADSAALLLTASMASGLRKISYQVSAPGCHGIVHPFQKPVFTTVVCCAANAVVFIAILLLRRFKAIISGWSREPAFLTSSGKLKNNVHLQHTVSQSEDFACLRITDVLLLILPSTGYFATMLLAGIGMLFIPASICFMVQASCIIFTALCSVAFLQLKLNNLHVHGIISGVAGVGVVSYAGFIYARNQAGVGAPGAPAAGDGPTLATHATDLLLGVSLTMASQLTQALQFVSEERLLRRSRLHPAQVIGIEGVLSTVLSVAGLAVATNTPGGDAGAAESWPDTVAQLGSSRLLLALLLFVFIGFAGNSYFGLKVSLHLGSVFRTVLLSLRTLLIWSANLALFYASGAGAVGEHWDRTASPIQCGGFVLLLLGTLLYARGSSRPAPDGKPGAAVATQAEYYALPPTSTPDLHWPDAQLSRAASPHKQPASAVVVQSPRREPPLSPAAGDEDGAALLSCRPSLDSSDASEVIAAAQPFALGIDSVCVLRDRGSAESTSGAVRQRVSCTDDGRSAADPGRGRDVWSAQESLHEWPIADSLPVGLTSFTVIRPGVHTSATGGAPPADRS
eukprot:jgi/Ulvmu1/2612/UM014_0063.1